MLVKKQYYPPPCFAQSASYSADEVKDVQKVQAAVEAQTGGKLTTYVPNHEEDNVHWWVWCRGTESGGRPGGLMENMIAGG